MNSESANNDISLVRLIFVGLLVGFLLNATGWIGNNLILRDLWQEVGAAAVPVAWRETIWKDLFSFAPDFLYGLAIAWLCVMLRGNFPTTASASLRAGLFVSLVGGITTYFAIANAGFIPWKLALASFVLVLATKLPLAVLAGRLLDPNE